MELFTDVDADSFRTGTPPFRCPTGIETYLEPCIALPSKRGLVLTAVYTAVVTLLFALCWKIFTIAVIS